jgi:hypothetical protein
VVKSGKYLYGGLLLTVLLYRFYNDQKKMGKNLYRTLGIVLILSLVAGISYISLLGENDRAQTTVKMYFDNIASQRYQANTQLCSDAYNRQFDNVNDPITHQFSLETALLNHFRLINTAQYAIEAQRSEFWFPYLGTRTIRVSVRVQLRGAGDILTGLMDRNKQEFIKDLVTLVREDGRWKIADIDIRTSSIAGDYQETKESMQHSKYVQQTAEGLSIKENTIEFATIDPIQKRIIRFNLNKALSLLNNYKAVSKN